MRAAEGGCHEKGGRHISGAERLVSKENLQLIASQMIERALTHTKGEADFINIVIEKLESSTNIAFNLLITSPPTEYVHI